MFAAIISIMLASCSKEDSSSASAEKSELGISVSISGTSNTRALVDAFTDNNQIAVFLTGANYTPKVALYTYNATSWTPPALETNKIYLSNETATVYGYYPASATITGSTPDNDAANTIDVTVNATETSFTGSGQIDYMYATGRTGTSESYLYPLATASNATGANEVNLYLHHALAKLSFIINKASSYTGDGTLTSVKLSKTDGFLVGEGTMALSDGTITALSTASGIEFTGSTTINAYNATPSTTVIAQGLAAPNSDLSGITLTLTIDGKVMTVALPATIATWAQGNNYTYTITVNGTELQATTVNILPWIGMNGGTGEVI